MIVDIKSSPRLDKRFRVTMDDGKTYDFGYRTGMTYIDHHSKTLRENYRKRHYANPTEKKLIDNLIPSPSLFAMKILWGDSTSIKKNIDELNNLWKKKYHK